MNSKSLLPLLLLTACSSPTSEAPPPDGGVGAQAAEADPATVDAAAIDPSSIDVSAWGGETIELPPAFAPGLPDGSETLRFAPSWRDPDSDEFWSYAFVMRVDGWECDAAALDDMFEQYYDGLMALVAEGNGEPLAGDPAQVEVVDSGAGRYDVRIRLVDAFGDRSQVDLRVRVDASSTAAGSTVLLVRATPQADDHPIWHSLDAAILGIQGS